jgi:hypothetical protein
MIYDLITTMQNLIFIFSQQRDSRNEKFLFFLIGHFEICRLGEVEEIP